MSDIPLVSVYITNHNYGRFIEQSIESVRAQSLRDFELIIIDDGSTDNSREVIERYADRPGIRIIYQQKKGLNVTNNIALRVARGRYIMRLDADDYLDPNALLVLSSRLEQEPELGLVFPDYYYVDAEGQMMGMERRHDFGQGVSVFDQPAHGACTMVRRQCLLDVGGYDERFTCQDGYDLWVKFVTAYKVANVNLPLFYYRQHGSNLTRNEDRILATRTDIKRVHAERRALIPDAVGVIAVRGPGVDPGSLALEQIGGRSVLDRLIDAALGASRLRVVAVTSSDPAVAAAVTPRLAATSRLVWVDRPAELARLNVNIEPTLRLVLEQSAVEAIQPGAVALLSENFPLLEPRFIDDAVHTLGLFEVDKVISVRPETSMLYQHDGHGLHNILNQDRFTKLEREALYRFAGGLTVWRTAMLRGDGEQAPRVGHVVVNQRSSHGVFTAYDHRIAAWLVEEPV
jgi:CMP-N-acetylneuraminic acid synthetase